MKVIAENEKEAIDFCRHLTGIINGIKMRGMPDITQMAIETVLCNIRDLVTVEDSPKQTPEGCNIPTATLHDYFAGQALIGLIVGRDKYIGRATADGYAEQAKTIADAMIEQKASRKGL